MIAKTFVWAFLYHPMEKQKTDKQILWPTQYMLTAI